MTIYTPDEFADALLGVVARSPRATVKVMRKAGLNMKNESKRNVQATAPVHNAHAQNTITFDVEAEGVEVVAEVGYDLDKGKAANLGNLLEYGGKGDHSPPHRDLGRALDGETPQTEHWLGEMGHDLLDGT